MKEVLREAIEQLAALRWRGPALLLFALVALTTTGIAFDRAGEADAPGVLFAGTAILRLAGLLLLTVALLRIGAGSTRPTWLPDGGFWLHGLLSLIPVVVAIGFQLILPSGWPIGGALANLATVPLAAWLVAAAVEKPLAWNPARWLRDFGAWLLPVFLASLVVVFPLVILHALLTLALDGRPPQETWPLILVDSAVSTVAALLSLALGLAAYRRVAKD